MANEISYKQLKDGTWGISGHNLVSGKTVTVTKKSGQTERKVVGNIVWKNKTDGLCYATIATEQSALAPTPKTAPKARGTSTRGTSTRRSSRRSGKHEGTQEGTYQSSREGDEGDTVGLVCWLKTRGTRIPVVVVGWNTGYCKEDGLLMYLPMDEGYYTVVYYRDATEDEATALTAKDTAAKKAKEASERAAKEASESAEKAARAPLEGLTRSDSLDIPKGMRTQVAPNYKANGQSISISKIELSDGRVVYHESAYMFDDGREYIWATEEVLTSLYEEQLAKHPISLEDSQEYLSKYSGCCGADIHRYVVARAAK
jgi:hypothetical protein